MSSVAYKTAVMQIKMQDTSCRSLLRAVLVPSLLLVLVAMLTACGKKTKIAKPPKIGSNETGIASWYGHPYHGRRAANGEIYDMEKLTAAHRTYPFNTWVRVTNLSNDRTVDVRIQDRGPFVGGRIIDLSRAAAREIEMIGPGVTKVRLTVIAPPKDFEKQAEFFGVQVGAFRERDRALTLQGQMRNQYGTAIVIERGADPPMYRVIAGRYESVEQAEAVAADIRRAGGAALAVRLDEPSVP